MKLHEKCYRCGVTIHNCGAMFSCCVCGCRVILANVLENDMYNRLWGTRCYEIGAMDRVADGGVGWRQRIKPLLQQLGIVVLDPTNKPIDIAFEKIEDREYRNKLKADGNYDELTREMKQVRSVDLRMVDMADFVIVHLDTDVHTTGTYEELFWANRLKNPILIHCEQKKDGLPDWLYATIPHAHMFSTWTDMFKYLWEVHTAPEVETYNRWMFFNYDKMVPHVLPEHSRAHHWDWRQVEQDLDLQ